MKKGNPVQIELFSSKNEIIKEAQDLGSAINYFRHHERIILTIICCLLLSIVSFSLGVKRGKQLMLSHSKEVPLQKTQTIKKEVKSSEIKQTPAPLKKEIEPVKKQANFTIQVATYKTKTYAKREAEKLEKKRPLYLSRPQGGLRTTLCR